MFISPAWAANLLPPSESTSEAAALSIILAVGLLLFLAHMGRKRWRKRRL